MMVELDLRAAGAKRLKDKVCLIKRAGRPEEQVATIAFWVFDDASFITGQVINCSGEQS